MNAIRPSRVVLTLVATLALAACGQESGTEDLRAAPGADSTSESGEEPSSGSDTVELTADSSAAGKCAVPSAETLAGFDTAFEGTVTSLADGTATLVVDRWYAGGGGASTVTVTTPSKALEDLLMAVDFQADRTYLVSATDGRVTLCGFSAEMSSELETLYESAFAG